MLPVAGILYVLPQTKAVLKAVLESSRIDGLEHGAALHATIHIGINVPDEAWLAAEVQQTLQNKKKICQQMLLYVMTYRT